MSKIGLPEKGKRNTILSLAGLILLMGLVTFILWYGSGSKGTANVNEPVTGTLYAMDTYMKFSFYTDETSGVELNNLSTEIIKGLEEKMSVRNVSSEVAILNRNGGGEVSWDIKELLKASIELNGMTDGAFDITIYPVMEAWGFDTGEYRIPSEEELKAVSAYVGMEHIQFSEEGILAMEPGVKVDFGGIAKGYAADLVTEAVKEKGCNSALLNLGGNVQTIGTKPDGSAWKIAVRDPEDGDSNLCIVSVSDKAVVTSGGYERYFEEEGVTYHHIMDPDTLKPAESGVISATIVTDKGIYADGLSTSLFVMGLEKATEFWRQSPIDFEFIILTEEGLYVTDGLKGSVTSQRDIIYVK